jgi:tetratricopeptide (TPR) repeat protein
VEGLQYRVEHVLTHDAATALPLFERAVAIDPDFALAYARLGIHYSNVRESRLARENTLKAYRLRDRVSDVERFAIDTYYDRQVTGNMERQQRTMESWARSYPRDSLPLGLLAGMATQSTGRYELGIAAADKAIALEPDSAPAYNSKAHNQLRLDRPADAEATIARAIERKLEFQGFILTRYLIAFLNGDGEAMGRQAALGRGQRGTEDMISHLEALALARSGRLQDARRTSAVAVESHRRRVSVSARPCSTRQRRCGRRFTVTAPQPDSGPAESSNSPGVVKWTMRRRLR